ncbi:uncharacterized protein H6S33_009523 [Morchella sextelata]|uniref:uncharacterized protein n=1 Tax=Morchella sextelata TaxID=1174677 RepID=UPI001D04B354|nr:uncharacterized protein H6S33_009523 [Morchella sextelata]KAH0613143.1 hypothetical protein H6S33_009523 [Morchella sextelata]
MHLDPGTARRVYCCWLAASTIIPRSSINNLRGAGNAERGVIKGEGKEALRTGHRGEDRLPDATRDQTHGSGSRVQVQGLTLPPILPVFYWPLAPFQNLMAARVKGGVWGCGR